MNYLPIIVGGRHRRCTCPCEVYLDSAATYDLLHSVTPTHRLRAPIFLLGGSSRSEKVSSGPSSEAGGAFGSRAHHGSIKIFHCPSIDALPLNVGGMAVSLYWLHRNYSKKLWRTAGASRINITRCSMCDFMYAVDPFSKHPAHSCGELFL